MVVVLVVLESGLVGASGDDGSGAAAAVDEDVVFTTTYNFLMIPRLNTWYLNLVFIYHSRCAPFALGNSIVLSSKLFIPLQFGYIS